MSRSQDPKVYAGRVHWEIRAGRRIPRRFPSYGRTFLFDDPSGGLVSVELGMARAGDESWAVQVRASWEQDNAV